MNELLRYKAAAISIAGLTVLMVFATPAPGQQPGLQIASPSDGTVVNPGQTVAIGVTPTPGSTFAQIVVIGEDPIGFSQVLTAPPFLFQLLIPNNIAFRKYQLTAAGMITPGLNIQSTPVAIDVESPSAPISIQAQPSIVKLRFVGDQLQVRVFGRFSNGRVVDITESSRTSYSTSNANIATVSATGLIAATGPGTTNLIINGLLSVRVSVPTAQRGDLNGDGKVTMDDLNILLDALDLNSPPANPFDARDLNKNGVIDADDVRLLLGLCGSACTGAGASIVPDSGTNCNGVYNGKFAGNISISDGQSCTFTGGSINGNVTQSGGTMVLTNSAVSGNVQVNGGGNFALGASMISGNVEIQNLPAGLALNSACGSQVQGNFESHNNAASVQIGSSTAACLGNSVGGNLQVNNNTASTTVFKNTVGGNLQCQNNSAITGGGNTAKQKQGQCVGF